LFRFSTAISGLLLHPLSSLLVHLVHAFSLTSGRDKVILKGLTFHGFHGAFVAEQELGQKFIIDAELTTDLKEPGTTDDLKKTINYVDVYKIIQQVCLFRFTLQLRTFLFQLNTSSLPEC